MAGLPTRLGYDFSLVRYNADGTLDTTFDGDGKVTTDIGLSMIMVRASRCSLTARSSWRAHLNGSEPGGACAITADGSLDTTFDGDGKVTTDLGGIESGSASVTVQPDGKILVAGTSNSDFLLVRYNTDGTLDNTFDGDGIVTTDVGFDEVGRSITLEPDGKILVTGWTYDGSNWHMAVARYNADGSLDTSFGELTPTSFIADDPLTTNANALHYTVSFSEAVTGVDASQFALITSGVSGASITSVTEVPGSGGTQYTIEVSTGSGDGTIELNLIGAGITDIAGNPLNAPTTISGPTYTIDKTPPDAPVVSGIAPDSGSSSSDGLTNSTTVTVNGTAEANSTVTLFNGATQIGTISADGSGNWSLAGVVLAESANSLTATATDAAGHTGAASNAFVATLDNSGPNGWQFTLANSNFDGASSIAAGTVVGTVTAKGDPNSSTFRYYFATALIGTWCDTDHEWTCRSTQAQDLLLQ